MPGNIDLANPIGVFPKLLYLSFNETRVFPILTTMYHDGTTERSLITDTVNEPRSIHNFKLVARLSRTELAALRTFYEQHLGPTIPFTFYNPFEASPGTVVGSNWDATGSTFEGRYTVRFNNPSWNEMSDLSRSNVQIELQEVA